MKIFGPRILLTSLATVFSFIVSAQRFTEVLPGFFKQSNLGFTSWCDINNDGLSDLFVTGFNLVSNPSGPGGYNDFAHSIIYVNNGDGTFRESGVTNIPRAIYGTSAFGDFNNDGWADLVVTGTVSGFQADDLSHLYINNHNETFSEFHTPLPEIAASQVLWLDYNGDGWQDLFMMGIDVGDNLIIKLLRNDRGKDFVDSGVSFNVINGKIINVHRSDALVGDFDNDMDPDIVLCQQSRGGYAVELYQNNAGSFTKKNVPIPQYNYGTVAMADFNADGNLDLVVNGNTVAETGDVYDQQAHFSVMLGDGKLNFTELKKFNNLGSYWGSVTTGDLNNDGRPDIVINGTGNGKARTTVFMNTGNDFTIEGNNLMGTLQGESTLNDFDGDGDLDIFVIGSTTASSSDAQSRLYRNNTSFSNLPPSIPPNPKVTFEQNHVKLSWDRSNDDNTPIKSISYNVRVGTQPDGSELLSGLVNPTGSRQVDAHGNVNLANTMFINPTSGDFYFQVQAIDAAYYESAFTPVVKGCIVAAPDVAYLEHYCHNEQVHIKSDTPVDFYEDQAMTKLLYSGLDFSFVATQSRAMYAAQTSSGCSRQQTVVSFTVSEQPTLQFLSNGESVESGESIVLSRCEPEQTFRFSVETNFPFSEIKTSTLSGTVIDIKEPSTVSTKVWDTYGCESTLATSVVINNLTDVFVPNVITPNGDGKNDFLTFNTETGLEVLLLNRYGSRVFYSSNYANEFDGDQLSTGVYYMQVNIKGCGEVRKEFLHIIR